MKTRPLSLLLTTLISTTLIAGSMAAPARAGSAYAPSPPAWTGGWVPSGAYQGGSVELVKHYKRKKPRFYRNGRRHYKYKRYKRRRHNNDADFFIGLGLGLLGSAILSAPRYRSTGNWCHVHRYSVRGMTFHRDVRCFKHQNWDHPSIVYVR